MKCSELKDLILVFADHIVIIPLYSPHRMRLDIHSDPQQVVQADIHSHVLRNTDLVPHS